MKDWKFEGKPALSGVYERLYPRHELTKRGYCYFDGDAFGGMSSNPRKAFEIYQLLGKSLVQGLPWREI